MEFKEVSDLIWDIFWVIVGLMFFYYLFFGRED